MEKSYILTLPASKFLSLIASADLNISDESYLIEVVRGYLQEHAEKEQMQECSAEDLAGPVVWALLTLVE